MGQLSWSSVCLMADAARLLRGLQKGGAKLGYEAEAFAIYDTMRYIKPPVRTVAVGSAFGEAAMLLAAGEKVSSMHFPTKAYGRLNPSPPPPWPACACCSPRDVLPVSNSTDVVFLLCRLAMLGSAWRGTTGSECCRGRGFWETGLPGLSLPGATRVFGGGLSRCHRCESQRISRVLMLLQGHRAALPSATIMLRQPIQRFAQMQASDIDIYRTELRKTNAEIVSVACQLPRTRPVPSVQALACSCVWLRPASPAPSGQPASQAYKP